MVEMLYRERRERVAMWEYTVSAIGFFLGIPTEKVSGLVAAMCRNLEDSIFQKSYTVDRIVQALKKQQAVTKDIKKQLERLDRMTV